MYKFRKSEILTGCFDVIREIGNDIKVCFIVNSESNAELIATALNYDENDKSPHWKLWFE